MRDRGKTIQALRALAERPGTKAEGATARALLERMGMATPTFDASRFVRGTDSAWNEAIKVAKGAGVSSEKQIVRVLEAVGLGCATSREVSAAIGLPLNVCSSYLSQLRDDGLIKVIGYCRFQKVSRFSARYAVARGQ